MLNENLLDVVFEFYLYAYNLSILAIPVSVVVLFLLGVVFLSSWFKCFTLPGYILSSFCCCLLVLYWFDARSASLGCLLNFIIVFVRFKYRIIGLRIFIVVFVFIICFIYFLSLIKEDSTSGRLLIYKVVFNQTSFKDWVLGIGFGKFQFKYNYWQANYFMFEPFSKKEALLSSSGFYLFNDWLQLILEIGVGKLISVIIIFFTLFRNSIETKPLTLIVVLLEGAMFNIIVTAVFIYSLHVELVLFLFLIILYCLLLCKIKWQDHLILLLFMRFLLIVIALFFFYWNYVKVKNSIKFKSAYTELVNGNSSLALRHFDEMSNSRFPDYNYYYNFAFVLYTKGNLTESLRLCDLSLSKATSTEAIKLKADILLESNMIYEAEKWYKLNYYILPGRLLPKLHLMNFYHQTKNKSKAKLIALEIINFKYKVNSEMVERIVGRAHFILQERAPFLVPAN